MNEITIYEIGGLLVTGVASLITFLKSSEGSRRSNTVIVATLSSILTILVTLRFEVLPKLGNHFKLSENLTSNAQVIDYAKQIEAASNYVAENPYSLRSSILSRRLKSIDDAFTILEDEKYVVQRQEMPEFALRLLKSSNNSIIATSYVSSEEWWSKPWGRNYCELNYDLVEKGIKISRVFIISDSSEYGIIEPLMIEQVNNGVEVLFVFSKDVDFRVTHDMIVIDNKIAGQLELTPEKGLKEAEFFEAIDDINNVRDRITSLIAQSQTFALE